MEPSAQSSLLFSVYRARYAFCRFIFSWKLNMSDNLTRPKGKRQTVEALWYPGTIYRCALVMLEQSLNRERKKKYSSSWSGASEPCYEEILYDVLSHDIYLTFFKQHSTVDGGGRHLLSVLLPPRILNRGVLFVPHFPIRAPHPTLHTLLV